MYTLDYVSKFSSADSLEFESLTELLEYVNDSIAENDSIRIRSKQWKGYIGTYPGICKTGEYMPAHKTILAKFFEGNLPSDAKKIISTIEG
jgi:hypothetical protein